jgi:YD repeat-containing protein
MGLREFVGACASAAARLFGSGPSPQPGHILAPRAAPRWPIAVLSLAAVFTTTLAVATTYTYDANGRLVGATNSAGQIAQYSYDVDGNLINVARPSATALGVFSFSPGRGPIGTVVTVQGYGFSTTATSDKITFNGVAATVTAATATQLTTTVPVGATTGPLAVTVGTATATTSTSFIVDATDLPPTITSFSPTIGSAGTAVTVNGTNFDLIPGQTAVQLDQTGGIPTSINNTKIIFPIPANGGSGKITVSTFYGAATTLQDLVVVPAGIATTSISQSTRITVGQAVKTFSVTTAGKSVAELFDATAGSFLTLQFSNMATNVAYSVYDRNNNLILSGTATSTTPSAHLPRLQTTGTYLLLMQPAAANAKWSDMVEADTGIVAGVAPVAVSTQGAGQEKRLFFTTTAGANLGLGLSSFVATSGNVSTVSVYDPNGVYVEDVLCAASGCDLTLSSTLAGTYTILVTSPSGSSSMSFNASLSPTLTATLTPNTPLNLSLPRNGQAAVLSFTATAGQTFALEVANQATVPAGLCVYYTVVSPNGTVVPSASGSTISSLTFNMPNLAAGTYQVDVSSCYGTTVTSLVTLVSGETGVIPIDGATTSYPLTAPGQNVYLTFNNTVAGANLGLGISPLSTPGNAYAATASVYNSAGGLVTGAQVACYQPYGCNLVLGNLPVGAYSVIVAAPGDGNRTMSFSATLSSDLLKTLSPNKALSLSVQRPGQNARLAFSAQAGQTVALNIANQVTVPANSEVIYMVLNPDGTYLTGTSTTTSTATLNLANLPQTGTYTVFVEPGICPTTALVTVATGITGTLAVNASQPSSFATTVPNQNVYLSFTNATAGANLGLGLSNVLTPGSTDDLTMTVYGPTGSQVASTLCIGAGNSCGVPLRNLAAGTYSAVVTQPENGLTGSFNATLSTDLTATLTTSKPLALNVTRFGQNADLMFTATAGQTATIQVAGETTVPANQYVVYDLFEVNGPTQTYLGMIELDSNATTTLTSANLPATGTYLVYVNALGGSTLSSTVTLGLQ